MNEWRVHRYSYGSQHTCFVLEYFRLYNTRARRIFPNHTYKEAPDFRRPLSQFRKIRTYSGNNLTPGVSCPRLQEHGAPSTGMRSQGLPSGVPAVLFYLGPEIIAALQGAYEATRENSRASNGLSQSSVDECNVMPSPVLSSSLLCPDASTVAITVTFRLLP